MIKYKGKDISNVILGRLKSVATRKKAIEQKDEKFVYKIDYKIRFPFKQIKEGEYAFMPITLSLYNFGIRTSWNKEVLTTMNINIDNIESIVGNFLITKTFTLKKRNNKNVEYEERSIVIESNRELRILDQPTVKRSTKPVSFELYDIKITNKGRR